MDIVEEIRKDRENGAKRLVSEYKKGLLTLARRFCSDMSDAEELVNRTFAEVLANVDRYAEQSAFLGTSMPRASSTASLRSFMYMS